MTRQHKSDNFAMHHTRKILPLLLAATPISVCAQTQQDAQTEIKSAMTDSVHRITEVVVQSNQMLGSKFEARNRTGSAYYISPEEIKKFGYTDINRMLKSVPGVNVYEEDGFGLRPNISLRGTKAERSERISLMEDGVLAAPAPYAAPAAYYFPNAGRMYAIEVLKGSSQVQYGPFTTGGAINMVSTPIPSKFSAKLNSSYGSYNTLKSYASIGNRFKYTGFLVEYLRYQSDGFRKDEPNERTGFQRNDLIAKFVVQTRKEEGINHLLELKFGFANETSDETYLGLSESDFATRPYFRYAGAQKDNLKTRHNQWVATYLIKSDSQWKITTNLYYNYFFRNWYKLNDVRTGITKTERRSIEAVLADPETNQAYFDIVTGKKDYIGEALIMRANHRVYHSRGIQTKGEYRTMLGGGYLTAELGIRYHADSEDRFQQDDSYSMKDGRMSLFLAGVPGSNANRITTAHAWSGYWLGKWSKGLVTLTAGMRYEDVDLLNRNYTKADPRRTGKVRIETPNHARALLPGMGFNVKVLPVLSAFGGIHKGFAPPSATLNQKAESSVNVEAGLRWTTQKMKLEAITFNNNYANMLGSDLAAQGGQGTLDQFNVGKAMVKGWELMFHYLPLPKRWKFQLPIQLSYTYTDTEMRNNFESSAWGNVVYGDEIPYIYKHAFNAQIGIEHKRVEVNFGARYNGDMRTAPGQGKIAEREKIPAHLILDASLKVHFNKKITLTLNAINLTNKKYLVSRHPSGLRAGHPFGIYGGLQLQL